ncbi:MAG: ATP-binding protein [Polyangiaceae bacterium]
MRVAEAEEQLYVQRRQLDANYRALPSVIIPAPFNALVVAIPLFGYVGVRRLSLWLLIIVVNSALNWLLRAAYLRRRDADALEPWKTLRALTAGVSGFVWGGYAAVFLWAPGRLDLQVYALLIVCLTSVGALITSAVFLPAFVAYTLACVTPVVVRFAAERDLTHWGIAIELVVMGVILLVGGSVASRSSRAQLLLARQNERLIAELRQAEEELVSANRSLNERVGERTTQLARAIEDKHESELQLVRAQKMEAIGRLAGGMAHDFNNVLTAIMGSASLLSEMLPENAKDEREEADEIIKGADRAARLTSQLLAFARGGLGQATRVDANLRLKQLSHLLRRAVGESHHLEIISADSQLVVWIDPGQLDQLVMNLVLNAKDASPPGKTILVSVDEALAHTSEGAEPCRVLSLRVKDEGSGMPPEVVDRIFEPFFTTKGERGTGLGLSTCFGIVQRASGAIHVDTALGQGTCFSVSLPLLDDAPASEATRAHRTPLSVSLREVLVVDDQEAVLRVVARALLAEGVKVHEARSAEDALALFEGRNPALDLVDHRRAVAEAQRSGVGARLEVSRLRWPRLVDLRLRRGRVDGGPPER